MQVKTRRMGTFTDDMSEVTTDVGFVRAFGLFFFEEVFCRIFPYLQIINPFTLWEATRLTKQEKIVFDPLGIGYNN